MVSLGGVGHGELSGRFFGLTLLTYKNKIYIPNVAYLKRVVMDEIHQDPYSGHPGYHKTIATARKQYFFARNEKGHFLVYF